MKPLSTAAFSSLVMVTGPSVTSLVMVTGPSVKPLSTAAFSSLVMATGPSVIVPRRRLPERQALGCVVVACVPVFIRFGP